MDIEAYFDRIGYKNSRNKLDLETLTSILQHHIRTIPFENFNMHCGLPMTMGLEDVFEDIVRKNRGGWCLQSNQLLYWALTTVGFETRILGAYVYIPPVSKYSSTMVHLLLHVTLGNKNYIVDAAFGCSNQMWEPLELVSGKDQPQVPSIFRLTEENGVWYMDQIKRQQYVPNEEFVDSELLDKNKYQKVYSFTLEPRKIEEFESVNSYLQESPTCVMKNTSFCSLQTLEGVYVLVGYTLTYRKFNYKDNVDLVVFETLKTEEIEEVLKTIFGISLEGKFVPKHGEQYFTI
ncbi:arylamine N-acetyltransferase 2-like [Dipodomys spectabilis]|uniref:arylamine N-acetyltransferase 2-like n=1 Tax=Dipodomys spectabilis TaxID=105255 RepID=UPI001C53BB25|nr:arylamine N-acetyltransferase 2-like [Dipodomys spectabilis]